MTRMALLALLAQAAQVAGQIFLKHAMTSNGRCQGTAGKAKLHFTAGISLLTLWFFLWIGLLQKWDLSYIFPFEGVSPVLIVLAACFLLNEKMPMRSWVGVALISVGVVLVGLS
ncbi:MAG: EamA family transporter [Nitrospinae bacterium]|nr:EamA family transporter [Nitrospinota bacterium]